MVKLSKPMIRVLCGHGFFLGLGFGPSPARDAGTLDRVPQNPSLRFWAGGLWPRPRSLRPRVGSRRKNGASPRGGVPSVLFGEPLHSPRLRKSQC